MLRSLADVLFDHARQLSLTDQVRYALQVALGMKYLHSKGIYHRDLKPANVLISEEFVAKLADVGLTKQLDRSKLRLIRARSGVLTTAELVEHTGSTFPEAEDEVGRLLGAYDGEAAVSPDGELVYAFPGLMASTGTSSPRPPNPAWMRLEPELQLTGNSAGANAVVAGMNTFTLVASATAPWFIFPRLGIGGAAAFWTLVIVPVVFSVLFFTGPLVRMIGVGFENRKRHRRNLRRVLTGFVYDRALRGRSVALSEAHTHIRSKLPSVTPSRNEVASLLDEFVAALDGEVSVADDGDVQYRFTAIREQYAAADTVRRVLELEKRQAFNKQLAERDGRPARIAVSTRMIWLKLEKETTHDLVRWTRVASMA